MSNQTSPFMSLREAAAFLRYSTSNMYRRSDIPRHKLPGSKDWRYNREELLAWAQSTIPQRLEPQPEPAQPATKNPQAPRPVARRRSSRYR